MRIAIYVMCIATLCADPVSPPQSITHAQQLYQSGDLQGAERLLLTISEQSNSPHQQGLAFSDLGLIYRETGRHSQAERVLEKSRALLEHCTEVDSDRAWLRTSMNLASMYMETGQKGKAERIVKQLIKTPVRLDEDAQRLQALVANLHMIRGRLAEAEKMFLAAADWFTSAQQLEEASSALNNLGVIAVEQGDIKRSVSYLKRALDTSIRGFGEDHPALIPVMTNYGSALHAMGQRAEGLPWIERALDLAKRWHGPDARLTLQVATLYSKALEQNGRGKEARKVRADVEGMSSALAARDPAVQTVDILDLAAESGRRSK
jgi:tetratricopeptide (TPR) repeat protein